MVMVFDDTRTLWVRAQPKTPELLMHETIVSWGSARGQTGILANLDRRPSTDSIRQRSSKITFNWCSEELNLKQVDPKGI